MGKKFITPKAASPKKYPFEKDIHRIVAKDLMLDESVVTEVIQRYQDTLVELFLKHGYFELPGILKVFSRRWTTKSKVDGKRLSVLRIGVQISEKISQLWKWGFVAHGMRDYTLLTRENWRSWYAFYRKNHEKMWSQVDPHAEVIVLD